MNALKDLLQKVPVGLLLAGYCGYLGYDYYVFTSAPESPLMAKQAEHEAARKEIAALQGKIKQANEFFKSLDAKRGELRRLAQSLDELKGTLSTEVDVGAFMKMAVTEARRVGINVLGMKPVAKSVKEYYEEQPFEMAFQGVYVQLLVFLDRLANIQNIVRVDDFELHPVSAPGAKFTELQGVVLLKAFKYVGSKADEIAQAGAPPAKGPPAPAAPSKAPADGKTEDHG